MRRERTAGFAKYGKAHAAFDNDEVCGTGVKAVGCAAHAITSEQVERKWPVGDRRLFEIGGGTVV